MGRWLRRHKRTWLAYPVRVQRAVNWRQKKRGKRRAKKGPMRPCYMCGYELVGLPGLTCPECGTSHEAAWYRGRLKAGGWARQMTIVLSLSVVSMGVSIGGFMVAIAVVLLRFSQRAVVELPRGVVSSGVTGGVSVLLSLVVGVWLWRVRRRLVWGPPRGVVVPIELSLVCALLGWLAWAL